MKGAELNYYYYQCGNVVWIGSDFMVDVFMEYCSWVDVQNCFYLIIIISAIFVLNSESEHDYTNEKIITDLY